MSYCRVPDHLGSGGDCRWPDGNIPFALIRNIRGVPEESYRAACKWAADTIRAACGADLHEVESAQAARVLYSSSDIDGPAGTLAQAQLPCGNVRQCTVWHDGGEGWDTAVPPTRTERGIKLALVCLHETCHALGLPHTSSPGNVLNPVYNPALLTLGPWDVAELRRRYGPPKASPAPPPAPPPPTPGGTMSEVAKFIRAFLPLAKLLAARTETPIDDMVVQMIERFLALVPANASRVEAVAAMRQVADEFGA